MARALRAPKLPVKLKIPRLPKTDEPYEDVFEEMTLAEHLLELRDRVVRAVIAVVLALIVGVIFAGQLFREIAIKANVLVSGEPGSGLDISKPTDSITIWFKIALYIAIAIAMPVLVYQFIAFLSPGLTRKEKRILFSCLPFVTALFVGGMAYGFFFAAPRAFDFLSNFQAGAISWDPDAQEVVNFFLTLMIGLGLAFQLPVIMFMLAKLNIVSPERMRAYRRFSYLGILIVAAIITPSTDPINMAIVAIPLLLLYEVGILLARVFVKTGVGGQPAAA
ncbi:MAG: twin-arginine translocase subunit TatC [Thermomicrobiales bacterium]